MRRKRGKEVKIRNEEEVNNKQSKTKSIRRKLQNKEDETREERYQRRKLRKSEEESKIMSNLISKKREKMIQRMGAQTK